MNKKAIIGVVITFFVTYFVVGFFQTERSRYSQLNALVGQASGSLLDMSAQAEQIGAGSSDEQLKLAATYIGTTFSGFYNNGYHDIAEVRKAGLWDVSVTGFVNGAVNPVGWLKGVGDTAWLMFHESDFKAAAAAVDARYGGINFTAIIISGIGAYVAFRFLRTKPHA